MSRFIAAGLVSACSLLCISTSRGANSQNADSHPSKGASVTFIFADDLGYRDGSPRATENREGHH